MLCGVISSGTYSLAKIERIVADFCCFIVSSRGPCVVGTVKDDFRLP